MAFRNWISTLRWLARSLTRLPTTVANWGQVLAYYSIPLHKRGLVLRTRLGYSLEVPPRYLFQSIAETTILNVYGFRLGTGRVVVDIGASIGDFTLFAATQGSSRVFAFEPHAEVFAVLARNVAENELSNIRISNRAADGSTLEEILECLESNWIDFLKMDCEGCEMDVLLRAQPGVLRRVGNIHMETHPWAPGYSLESIVTVLKDSGFCVELSKRYGGSYLRATREPERSVASSSNPPGRLGMPSITDM